MKTTVYFVTILFVLSACSSGSSHPHTQPPQETKPAHHTETGFRNFPLIESAAPKGILFYLRRAWGSVVTPSVPDGHALTAAEATFLLNTTKGDKISWLGHASFLLKVSETVLLTDPFLTKFASPIIGFGPKRFVEPAIAIDKLPQINIVLVSHNHFDHLDDNTVRNLTNKESIHVVVPLGLKHFFLARGYQLVTELDWGQSVSIDKIKITSHPAVHDSARSINDRDQTLWSSWVIETPNKTVFFAGDTGYSDSIFKRIAEEHSPIDYAILPIGAYEPRELMWMSHVTPEEAVAIGTHLQARTLIASHWGTISSLSDEPPFEPPLRFKESGVRNGFSATNLWRMRIGETRSLSREAP